MSELAELRHDLKILSETGHLQVEAMRLIADRLLALEREAGARQIIATALEGMLEYVSPLESIETHAKALAARLALVTSVSPRVQLVYHESRVPPEEIWGLVEEAATEGAYERHASCGGEHVWYTRLMGDQMVEIVIHVPEREGNNNAN